MQLHESTKNHLQQFNLYNVCDLIKQQLGQDNVYSILSSTLGIKDTHLENIPFHPLNQNGLNKLLYTNLSEFGFNLMLGELLDTKIMVIDTETTDLRSTRQPVQISSIVLDIFLNPIDAVNFYIPQDNISQESLAIHKLTPEFLQANKSNTTDILEFFNKWDIPNTYNTLMVGYNISFDIKTLENFLYVNNSVIPNYFNNSYCLLRDPAMKELLYPNLKSKKLQDVVQFLNLSPSILNAQKQIFGESSYQHDARFDILALAFLLGMCYSKQGVQTVWDI